MGDSDDDMPPLEYVGAVPGVTNPAAKQVDDDDDMPPLEYVGTLPTSTAGKEEEDDDDMPPLEYVGTDASLGISLREGERVTLKGLSKDSLNGQTGTLQSFAKASKGRLPVKLDKTGSMLAVKPENIEKLSAPVAKSAGAMPPLQSVGASAKGAAAYPAASAKGASAPKSAAQASPQANGASHGLGAQCFWATQATPKAHAQWSRQGRQAPAGGQSQGVSGAGASATGPNAGPGAGGPSTTGPSTGAGGPSATGASAPGHSVATGAGPSTGANAQACGACGEQERVTTCGSAQSQVCH